MSGLSASARAPEQYTRGMLLLIGACSSFALLDSISKYLSAYHHPLLIAWARYVFHVLVMLLIYLPSMGRRLFATRRPVVQLLRGLCLGLSSVCFFSAIAQMPQAEATALAATAPILVTIGAVLWLKESTPRGVWWSLAASFAGVLLIVRPGSSLFGWAAVLPLLTALLTMGYQLLTRLLSGVDNGLATLFIGAVVAAILLTVIAPGDWTLPTRPWHMLLFVATGVIGAFGHLMLVRAYESASAASLAPFGYTHAVAAVVAGLVFFGQFPDGLALLGIALIVATGVTMAIVNKLPLRPLED
ncbi:MAG: DMT family transporter [Burkholderiaceae bacterium]